MNNKIKKYCVVTLLCYLCFGFVAGSNNLKIFRNVDDRLVEVSSKIEVLNGANLTLICQIENIKNKGIINGYVTWFIPPKIHSEVKLRTLKNSSNLVFRNVNIDDEALYVCASLKFKLFKTVRLLLKQSESAEPSYLNIPRLTKRDIVPGTGLYVFNESNSFIHDRDLDELRKYVQKLNDDIYIEIENEKKWKTYELDNDNYDLSTNNRKDLQTKTTIHPLVLFFVVLIAVFAAFLLLCLCIYMRQNSSRCTRNNRQPNIYNPGITVPRPNRCGHVSCSPSACRFQDISISTTTVINSAMDIEEPLIHNPLNPTTQLDLPPTYSSSAHNSTQNLNEATNGFDKTKLDAVDSNKWNLPPSYDEAIGHKDDNRIAGVGHNYNGNRSSGHNHVHHSTADGINGNDDSGRGGDSRGSGDSGGGGGDSGGGGGDSGGGGGDSGGGGGDSGGGGGSDD